MNALKTGRNDPCPCGSGKKHKQCCMANIVPAINQMQANTAAIHQAMQSAWMHQQAGRTEQAVAMYHQVIQVAPKCADAHHLLGVIALQDGNVEVAVEHFRKAISINTQNPQFYSNFGLALHEQGKLDFAKDQYKKAIKIAPNYADAYYNLHGLLLNNTPAAIDCIKQVLTINPEDADAQFVLGLLLDYSGNMAGAEPYFASASHASPLMAARVDAWHYIKSVKHLPLLGSNVETFKLALAAAKQEGLVLEFGVRHGNSIRQIASLAKQEVHGFDSFEGLPEEWHHEAKGAYTTKGAIPVVPKNVKLHAGWFENTLPAFIAQHPENIRLINIDCDLYSSTKTVLDLLAPRIVSGTVIIFDEYIGNLHWREDEYKAFQEAVKRYGWRYEYLSFSFFTKQVAVIIL